MKMCCRLFPSEMHFRKGCHVESQSAWEWSASTYLLHPSHPHYSTAAPTEALNSLLIRHDDMTHVWRLSSRPWSIEMQLTGEAEERQRVSERFSLETERVSSPHSSRQSGPAQRFHPSKCVRSLTCVHTCICACMLCTLTCACWYAGTLINTSSLLQTRQWALTGMYFYLVVFGRWRQKFRNYSGRGNLKE